MALLKKYELIDQCILAQNLGLRPSKNYYKVKKMHNVTFVPIDLKKEFLQKAMCYTYKIVEPKTLKIILQNFQENQ